MSSHREAPEISKDPVADSTDLYAFVSPDQPDSVTIIANYVPLEEPAGGPNFYEFGDDVLYEIHIVNGTDVQHELTYQFRFQTQTVNPNSFLYNTGQITSINSPNWNRPQFYSVTRVDANGKSTVLASGLACPPCNIGPRSTPNYQDLAENAIRIAHRLRPAFSSSPEMPSRRCSSASTSAGPRPWRASTIIEWNQRSAVSRRSKWSSRLQCPLHCDPGA